MSKTMKKKNEKMVVMAAVEVKLAVMELLLK
jgi:hypothetical protein